MKQRRGIRSIIIRAGIFLLLGAIVNVAVAWGGVLWSAPDSLMIHSWGKWGRAERSGVSVSVSEGWMRTEEFWYAERSENLRQRVPEYADTWISSKEDRLPEGPLLQRVMMLRLQMDRGMLRQQLEPESQPHRPYNMIAISAGWPCRSINTDVFMSDRDNWLLRWVKDRSIDHFGGGGPCKVLLIPLWILWPGFALNTLFYAAMLWLLLALPVVLRRRLRLKRGLCPACAYPVGTSPVCTECGKALPQRCRG